MSYQIIMQPDKKFAIWSSIIDELIFTGLTQNEVLEFFGEREKIRAMKEVSEIIMDLLSGRKPYFQLTQTWDLIQARKTKRDDRQL